MTRDQIDYENNKVYTWKKPLFFPNCLRRNSGKQVSFFDQNEPADDTLAHTASDSSPEQPRTSTGIIRSGNGWSPGNPHGANKKAKKKLTIKKQGEEAGDTKVSKNTHYTLRGKTKQ